MATFTGRAAELETLDRLLGRSDRGRAVVTAIDGAAGVGKTALAVRWARRNSDRFPDGLLFVNLRGHAEEAPRGAGEALGRLLRALGLPAERVPTDVEERMARYRSLLAGKRLLLVLDDAGSAEQVRPLLPSEPGCHALVTARSALTGLAALDDAHLLTLDPLTPDEAVDLLTRMLGPGRVSGQAEATAELARLCGYLPLALRIVAAHLADRERPFADMVTRLDQGDRLAALRIPGDPRAAVQEAFDHSYRALDAPARRLFRRLGLVSGPDFGPHCAAVLVHSPLDEAEGLLEDLVTAHMVERSADGRYRLHDLLRDYAAARLGTDDGDAERTAAVERVCRWYLHTGINAARALNPVSLPEFERAFRPASAEGTCAPLEFTGSAQALAWCETERINLVAAIGQAADHGLHAHACQLSSALWWFFYLGKHWNDWITTHRTALAAASHLGDPRVRAWLLNRLGHAHALSRECEAAVAHCQESISLFTAMDGPAARFGVAANHYTLGTAYHRTGRFDRAIKHTEQAMAAFRELGDRYAGAGDSHFRWLEASSASQLAAALRDGGRPARAADHLRRALELMRRVGHYYGAANALDDLGKLHRDLGEHERAVDNHREALAIRRRFGEPWGEAETLDHLGNALHRTGRTQEAHRCWHQAAAIYTRLDGPGTEDGHGRQAPAERRRALLLRVHAFIEERLGDPDLSPPMIAAAHHVSVRYLHKLFASDDRTVSGWIRHRRLERCRRDLLNPALRARPVSAIARQWGFPDPGNFSRVFRRAYGVPPSRYREN